MSTLARVLLLALSLAGVACGSAYRSGIRAYDHARYPEALEELRRSELDFFAASSAQTRARYALYRGLTHLALGDRPATLLWLWQAKRALDACPTLLSEEDAGRLATAWSHLPLAREPLEPP